MKIRFALSFVVVVAFSLSLAAQQQPEQVSLEQVIALALEKNYDIKLAKNTGETASTNNAYAWGAFLPTVNASGSYIVNQNKQKIQYGGLRDSLNREGTAKANNTTAVVQLNWLLFDGTRMFATRERIATLNAQGELLVKDQIVNTIASIITNYYNIVRQKQQLRAIHEQMGVSEERVKLAERKLDVGIGGKPELLQARVDYNAQRTAAIQQEATIAQLKQQLNGLVDLKLPNTYDVSDTILIDLNIREEDVTQNYENRNFALQASQKNVDVARLALRERRAELLPQLNFGAAYNYSINDNVLLINPLSPAYNRNKGYQYGLTLTMPILNNFNQRRLIELQRVTLARSEVLYTQMNTNVNVGVRNAYVNYKNTKDVLLIEEENILLAKENVQIALESFRRGVATFIELRTAQQSLADAYNRLINARYLAKAAETELLRLNGALLR